MTLKQYLYKNYPKDWFDLSPDPHSPSTPMIISYRLYASYDDVVSASSTSASSRPSASASPTPRLSASPSKDSQPYNRCSRETLTANEPPRHSTPVLRGRAPYPLLSDQLKRANFAYTYVEATTGRLIFVCYLD